ncbi:MAG TPA: winged helix-turn-helix domain-containing protein [Pyrinomonadaceae bacterium]|nr:winged helix-turn-helix domain-containing protein [Pyrinomonadaceae bacterium]
MIEEKAPCFEFDDVRVEPRAFKIWKAGREVSLEPKAFKLLLFLMENRGRLIEKGELLDAVWKDTFVTENALTREIAKLRKMLGDDPRNAKYIETVHTQGYRFIARVERGNGQETPEAGLKERSIEPSESGLPDEPLAPAPIETVKVDRPAAVAAEPASTGYPWPKVLALAALTVAISSAAIIFVRTRTKPEQSEATTVLKTAQITTWMGLDIYPTLSPDGSSIAYSSDHGGNFEIYVKPLAPGGREIQITSDGGQNLQPAWSPNGQQIAYYSKNRGGIWVVPALGGVARRLTEFGSEPAWSPDGSMIAFQSDALTNFGLGSAALPPSTLWTIPSVGGQPKQITQVGTPSGGHGDPSWSPDGRRIMFVASDVNLAEVWSVSARGDELKPLAPPHGQSEEPGYSGPYTEPIYSPDGEGVYFAGVKRGVNFGIWKIPISPGSGEPLAEPAMVLSTGFTPVRHLTISADGKKLAYSAQTQTSNLRSVPVSPVTNEATGPSAPLMEDTSRRKSNPIFSPDGKRIALTIWSAGSPVNVWLIDADGKNPVQLTTDPGGSTLPSWLRDNDQIVYVSDREGRGALVSLNLKSRIEQPIFEFEGKMSFIRLSPDGKQIAYNSRQSGNINLWTSTLDGAQPRQLTFDKELAGFPSWSPDGQLLAFMLKRGDSSHVAVIQSGGGEPVQLTFDVGQSFAHSWSPDGERIAFAGFRKGFWNVWWVSRKDKTQKQLTNHSKLNAYVRYPAWSPLGNQIVYEYAETTGNIWLAELK